MKNFARVLLCFALWTVSQGNAQETFAPLITDNCVAFVHVDFSKVEIDKVKANLQKLGDNLLRELGFDEQSHKATARELAVELEKLDLLVRPQFDTLTKELGIRELAVIVDMELITQGIPTVTVIPWKNKTDKQFETFCTLLHLEHAAGSIVNTGDFLLFPDNAWSADEVADWAKRMTPSAKAPIFEALKSVAGAEIKAAAVLPEQVRMIARSVGIMAPDIPSELKGILLFAINKIQWASAAVSLSEITGSEPLSNADVLLTVKLPNQADAEMLREMLEQLIDFGVNTFRAQMEQPQIPPLVFQFTRGMLRTLLPDVEDDTLVFRDIDGSQFAVPVVGMGVAFLLPAVQAARQAARRMQCTNNIKQILLAIHNHHDAQRGLPPLYTVDENDKPLHSWRVLILPYIEQQALYQQIRLDEPWDSEYNKRFHNVIIPIYACPSNSITDTGKNCVYSVIGHHSVLAGEAIRPGLPGQGGRPRDTFARIADGTSNTIAIVEVKEPFCWMDPTADITLDELVKGINTREGRVGSNHTGGINVGMFDGSVHFISNTIDLGVLRALGTCAGGENVATPR